MVTSQEVTATGTRPTKRPNLLIEEWLPIEELGIECRREGSVGLHPPPNRLHVWWARRPLTVSRAAVLASLLPNDFPRNDFMKLMGITGDPIADRRRIDEANKAGTKLSQGFKYNRAFTNPVPQQQLLLMRSAIGQTWGSEKPVVLDSFAGGGSIPFEAMSLGIDFIANELNPVASVIEHATMEFPQKYAGSLIPEIEKWGEKVAKELERQLALCFPKNPGEEIFAYIWVRTVRCPECDLIVPLSPNWWLDKEGKLAFQPVVPKIGSNQCSFRIVSVGTDRFNPDEGSVSSGKGQCLRPGCRTPVDGRYIKEQAQKGKLGHQLVAIGYKSKAHRGRHFREVTDSDLNGVKRAEELLEEKISTWEGQGLVPVENYPAISNDPRPLLYGMPRWCDFFSPRQLLVHLTTLECIRKLPLETELEEGRAKAVRTYLALVLDKELNYDGLLSLWHPTRLVIANVFDRHDFAFIWSYGEFDGSSRLWLWALAQITDAYKGLVKLLSGMNGSVNGDYLCGDAASLSSIPTGSIPCAVVDPPYSDNVMYAELSDYFYVWMKRVIGDVYPELFSATLTDKDSEAVANKARFRDFKGKQDELAQNDYEAKMKAAFKEIHRVLIENGILTVMFTHKSDDAWDALGRGLIDAGFEITASWPVHTESEHSLHQARKVAAGSTILLVCRKRRVSPGTRGWWEDIRPLIRDVAYEKAKQHFEQGIRGVDLMLSTYGPALKELSGKWPVMDRSGNEIRPREALEEAGRAASDFRMKTLTDRINLIMDMPTRFYIHAWDYYQAKEIPANDAIKLSHTLNVDIGDLESRYGLIKKKGNKVIMQNAKERAKGGYLGLSKDASYRIVLDKVHATELVYEEKGVAGVKRLYQEKGFLAEPDYSPTIEALLNSLPPGSDEYETLKNVAQYAMQSKLKDRRSSGHASEMGLDYFTQSRDKEKEDNSIGGRSAE